MARKLEDAVAAVARLVGTVPGLRGSPSQPPEKITEFPFAITTPGNGEWQVRSKGYMVGLHTIGVWIHMSREDLPRKVQTVTPFGELVAAVLLHSDNTSLPDAAGNPTASAILALRYTFGPLGYVTVPTMGYAFELDIKIEQ